ncbi:hypothetical protein Q9Q_00014 [Enterococcus faecalis EnGen0078]|uniref:DUF2184 domain-containing protein n=1 Tax=Enterococcus faecalis TaxID=1351 RepID=UPI000330D3E0|nr:family 1 encapsulin nanocompartment shell protein [Enterococcus faecalis]MDU2109074.1 family 1 encapsulin nanocompartment shell protein [Peptoniphilus lacydonensis]EIP8061267.1 DUF2184 domain-containing protein [Enterococcus faecalis]EKZ0110785.1 DUF2184 domain-containing protein [Enterococcus faecalis]EOE10993.1 hypothetical protein Q9Q_00014 [Enterococcus faecalis EnGen0078]EOK32162.1 hypothetical protein WU9_00982 [Enterococcus faecalis EnGen0334]
MSNEVTATLEARDLQAIDNVIYQAPQEELVARTLFNVKTDINPGAETYAYNVMTRSGAAKIIANGADDLPLVDVDMKRYQSPIFTIAAGIRYSRQEIRQAQMMGTSIDATKAEVARRTIAEKENSFIFVGDPKVNHKGVANAEGIQVINSPKKWKEMTSEEIVEQLRTSRAKITIIPGFKGSSLKLLVAPEQYEELNRRYGEYDARSIMKVVQENGWFSSIEQVYDLKGVGTDNSDSFIIMDTKPSTCEILLPEDIVRLEVEWSFPNWKVPFVERCGGALIRTPYAIVRVDGI